MERYYSPKQVAELLAISKSKAYEIIDQMPRLQSPLRVSESALKDWVARHTVYPLARVMK